MGDGLARVDVEVDEGELVGITKAWQADRHGANVDGKGAVVLPRFADIHTHIDKAHTCQRSPNPTHTLSGADDAVANDIHNMYMNDVAVRPSFRFPACLYAILFLLTFLLGASALAWHPFGGNSLQLLASRRGWSSACSRLTHMGLEFFEPTC